MRIFELITIGAALFNLVLTVFVFSRDWRAPVNRAYLLWGLPISVWNFGTFYMFRVVDDKEAFFWARFLQCGVVFLPVTLLHLSLLIAQVRVGKWLKWFYAAAVALLASNLGGYFISGVRKIEYVYSGVRKIEYAYYSVAGPAFWPFLALYGLAATATLLVLYRRQKETRYQNRDRLRYMIVAVGILIVFGTNDISPIFGVDYYPFTGVQIYPLGSLAAIFYSVIVSYSVLQHQLLDVHVKIGRMAAHIVRIMFLFVVGFCVLVVLVLLDTEAFTPYSFFSALAVLIAGAWVATVFFPRLFGQGDDQLERRLLGDRFEYHDRIQGFIRSITSYSDTGALLKDFHNLLVRTVGVQSYHIILMDETTYGLSLYQSHPTSPSARPPEIHRNSPVYQFFRERKTEFLSLSGQWEDARDHTLEAAARAQMSPLGGELCFCFHVDSEPFGLLLVGEKANGEPFTRHDLYLLISLVKNLSLVINQIRLKNQVLLAEELELLGRMSRGMAHDLNNLLTPVSTFLQLFDGGMPNEEASAELVPVSLRNVRTIQAYIKESLFFSQNHELHIEATRMDLLLKQVADLAEPKLKRKQVSVGIHAPEEVSADVDAVLVQRLLGNLLSNAIDASPAGAQVGFYLDRLPSDMTSVDWFRIRVVDAGHGIKKENLKRVSIPYFTTKNSGDADRGFGLGLAICRKVVHLHGGSLTVTSEENVGTTVLVILPGKHVKRSNGSVVRQ